MDNMNKSNANSKKIAYNADYNKSKYKQLKAFVKPADYDLIDNYCKNSNISKAQFIVKCCKYVIDNKIDI